MVKVNFVYLLLYGMGGMLYFCFYMIGVGDNIGVVFVKEYIFFIFCVLVGLYFKNGLVLINFIVFEYDWVVGWGIGVVKVGGNYVVSFLLGVEVYEKEFSDCIYLDLYMYMKIEEVGVVNFFGIIKDGIFIMLKLVFILLSIIKYLLLMLVKECLGMMVFEGDVYIDWLVDFFEVGVCGIVVIIFFIGGI